MKFWSLLLLALPNFAYGQLIENGRDLKVYDTVTIIQVVELEDKSINISEPEYAIYFDKKLTILSIEALVTELKRQERLMDWQLEAIHKIERVKEFIKEQDSIYWERLWSNRSLRLEEDKNDEELAKELFWELVCPMIEKGQFELKIDSEPQNIILKTSSKINGAFATVYVSKDQVPFWMCPPITVD